MNGRSFLNLVVSLALFGAPGTAMAKETTISKYPVRPEHMTTYFARIESGIKYQPMAETLAQMQTEKLQKLDYKELIRTKGLGSLEHVGHNLLLLFSIMAVTGAAHEHHLAPLRDQKTDYVSFLGSLANQMVNNTGLYMSMVGAAASGALAGITMMPIQGALTADGLAGSSARFLANGYFGLITNVGFEAFNRLQLEAISDFALDAKTPEERKAAQADMKIALELPFLKVMDGVGTPEQNRVFGKLLWFSLLRLTFVHPERSVNWMANFMRLNVLTGGFVTVTASFFITGAAAGAIAGGGPPGFLLGGAAGLVGGIAAHMVPDKYNQAITDGFRRSRMHVAGNHLGLNKDELDKLANVFGDWRREPPAETLPALKEVLKNRQGWRNTFGTVIIEQTYDAVTKYQYAQVALEQIDQKLLGDDRRMSLIVKPIEGTERVKLLKLQKEFGKQMVKSRRRAEFYLRELLAHQDAEIELIESYRESGKIMSLKASAVLRQHVADLLDVNRSVRQMTVGFFPDLVVDMNVQDFSSEQIKQVSANANVLLNLMYQDGYAEELFHQKPETTRVAQQSK